MSPPYGRLIGSKRLARPDCCALALGCGDCFSAGAITAAIGCLS